MAMVRVTSAARLQPISLVTAVIAPSLSRFLGIKRLSLDELVALLRPLAMLLAVMGGAAGRGGEEA